MGRCDIGRSALGRVFDLVVGDMNFVCMGNVKAYITLLLLNRFLSKRITRTKRFDSSSI